MRRDEEAALHVVEALLAGMIILTAVLFMTYLSKPSPTAFESGLDLERVSVDTLRILENRPAQDSCDDDTDAATPGVQPPVPCYPNRLEEMVSHAAGFGVADAADQAAKTAEAEDFLRQVIPVGNRWLLRLDNGQEPLVLLPSGGSNLELTPRGAKGAETFLVPQWQGQVGDCGAAPGSSTLFPGSQEGSMDVAAGDTLEAPAGTLPPAGAASWAQWWVDEQVRFEDAGVTDAQDRIPPTAPYGWWEHNGACRFVGLPDGTATDYPAYGIQLVVWPIAG